MKVLFDHNVPKRLRTLLPGHQVATSRELGWDTLRNGDLLNAAETNGYEAMVTGDKNMSYQQNLEGRRIALLVLADTDWPTLKQNPAPIVALWMRLGPEATNCLRSLSFRAVLRVDPARKLRSIGGGIAISGWSTLPRLNPENQDVAVDEAQRVGHQVRSS